MTDTKSKDPVAAAIALAPQIKAAKDEIQSQSTLPGPLADAMAEADLFQLFFPKAVGGAANRPADGVHGC